MPQESSIHTGDNLSLYTIHFAPEQPNGTVIIIVHGYGEHIRRYDHIAEALRSAGYDVYGIDHRGHGRSEGERVHVEDFDHFVYDLRQFFDTIRQQHPDAPIFLLAHSMGSLIGLSFALRWQDELQGIILSGTAVHADRLVSPALITFGKILRPLLPKLRLSPSLDAEAVCSNPDTIAAYNSDPLIDRGNTRIGLGIHMLETAQRLHNEADRLHIPLLILHGADDEITPISGAEHIRQQASGETSYHSYPGLRHEVLNERIYPQIVDTMLAWLSKH